MTADGDARSSAQTAQRVPDMKKHHPQTPTEALETATSPIEIIQALERKAKEYIEAVFLEIRRPLDQQMARSLELALLQDFIEIHNASVREGVRLPENKAEIAKLLA